ncbi:prolyl oligopeptidase family serine peptidase [Nonomuraea sp. PA05]|uniref:prolyl oligopeptidase family serine peptidase n=1 Tax=Nonomuraea sp. PA05 TaxID=2604466 RepID=UPI0011D656C6|nr:prolyl oligopeptidase family serine peptidase [Nonomuraea sp. PA05]TYB65263.1 prolyl oligopeptidase family serine peptidase [Nonomuraea sp. PA05]
MSMTYPAAPARPERNEVGGLAFDDPYQWLEDDTGDGVAAWQRAQDELARSYVHAWPHHDRLAARVGELVEQMDARNLVVPVRHGPRWFRGRIPAGRDLMVLEVADAVTGPWRTVIDLNELSEGGTPLRISPQPSPDGRLLAYSLDASGRELPELKVIEIDTGKVLLDGVPQQRPGLVAWLPDATGFFYMANAGPAPAPADREPRAVAGRVAGTGSGQEGGMRHAAGADPAQSAGASSVGESGVRRAPGTGAVQEAGAGSVQEAEAGSGENAGAGSGENAGAGSGENAGAGSGQDTGARQPAGPGAAARMPLRWRLFFHRIGQPPPTDPEPLNIPHMYAIPKISRDGRWAVLQVDHLRPRPHFLARLDEPPTPDEPSWQWREFITDTEHLYKGVLAGDSYVAVTTAGAPRGRLVRIPLDSPGDPDTWTELIPGGDAVLTGVTLAGDRLVLGELVDTVSRIRVLDLDGKEAGEVPLPGPGSVSSIAQGVVALGVMDQVIGCEDAITFGYTSYTQSPTVYHYALATGALTKLQGAGHTLPGLVTTRIWATSADGTRVPCTLVHRADLDRSRPQPTLIHAYGGFNVAELSSYLGPLAAFVEAGGVYAHAHVRGGGEFGLQWWEAGRLHVKQNSFNDLYAIAEQLIADGITAPDRLAVQGASNGGLLAGVAVTQRPDLWRAAVCGAPKLDLMRVTRDPIGTAATLPEYGNPNDPADAPVLMGYSPYHHVRPGTPYPAILLDAGANDPRCPAWHSRKFAARTQSATTSPHPVLLRVWEGAGHGGASWSTIVEQQTYWLAFVMRELDLVPLPS